MLSGDGSVSDVTLFNHSGSPALEIPTGTINLYAIGNVGIGTATPFSVSTLYTAYTTTSLTAHTAAASSWAVTGGTKSKNLTHSNVSPYPISLQTRSEGANGNAFPIALNPLGGNVGIGTTAPSVMLDVNGNSRVYSQFQISGGFL